MIWTTRKCEDHTYEGIPPCPVPGCPNGTERSFQTFIAGIRLTSELPMNGAEVRYFKRTWKRLDRENRRWLWIELTPQEDQTGAGNAVEMPNAAINERKTA